MLKSSRTPTDAQSFPLPLPSLGYRISGKELEVRDSDSRHHQLCGCCNLQLIQSRAAPSHGPAARVLSPLSLWLQSLSCCLSRVARRSTPKPRGPPPFPQNRGVSFPHFRTTWTSIYLLASEPRGSPSFRAAWSTPYLLWSRMVSSFLPQNLLVLPTTSEPHGFFFLWLPGPGLNPSAHLPLQPHFRPLLQSVTPASIPVFFQLYWAAIVSLGRCGPMAWSQSTPRSHAGPVTRGSCFPVPSWVEVTPIPLAQSMATAT